MKKNKKKCVVIYDDTDLAGRQETTPSAGGLGMEFLVKLAPLEEPCSDAGTYVATSANWEALDLAVRNARK